MVFHLMEDQKKVPSTQILVEVEVVELHFEVNTKVRMVDIINMKVNFMEVNKEILEEGEVMEATVEIIEVNNQTLIQTIIIVKNLGTWQRNVIKGSMMYKMENYNKGFMHQLAIKVMSNCL